MFYIVMGVSGSGKSTIGQMLAERLGCPFYDGDDYHPQANVDKMAAGIPLDDDDRAGWLAALADLISDGLGRGETGVIACSALKKKYRDVLRVVPSKVQFVYLKGSYEAILARMQRREGHFMKPAMLQSQFAALEEPRQSITIDVTLPPEVIVDQIMEQMMERKYALGLLGLGVMGRSLAQNLERNGWPVIGYDPYPKLPEGFSVRVATSVDELVGALAAPRIVFLMVPAGAPVDTAIASLRPHLAPGDIIIDGGNSYFTDTEHRLKELEPTGIHFVGMGVSGGESGALWGPSMMPGGSAEAWERIRPMFESIAAAAEDGAPCVAWMGGGGAGHFVKMVHNGIEYADMELIAEVYDLLHRGAGLSNAEVAAVFESWNRGPLRSYLIEITAKVLRYSDGDTGRSLVDLIVDSAGQKGTGRWTSQIALELGSPIPSINEAVVMRGLSGVRTQRAAAAAKLGGTGRYVGDPAALIEAAEGALYAGKAIAYAQGMSLLKTASDEYGWNLDMPSIARVWRAGCIIRADLLSEIAAAFERDPGLPNLLLDDAYAAEVVRRVPAWRTFVQTGVALGIPLLAISASLGYYDAYRSERLPANLIQAQRDFFGAHTYQRLDKDGTFTTDWEAAATPAV